MDQPAKPEWNGKVLDKFAKSETEEVRISESNFKGKTYIDMRLFIQIENGDFIPTKKGLSLNKELFEKLKEALNKIK